MAWSKFDRETAKALFRRRVAEDFTFEGLIEIYTEAIDELHELKHGGPPAWKHTEARLRKENGALTEEIARLRAHTPYGTKVWESDE
jgi:hypothetical protein